MTRDRWTRWAGAALLGVGLAAAGCSPGGTAAATYKHARLEGKVTLDGKPIDGGTIQFIPSSQGMPPITAPIMEGRYVASEVGLGKGTVQITVEPPPRPEYISSNYKPPAYTAIPDRYKKGIPYQEVTADKSNLDFDLTSK